MYDPLQLALVVVYHNYIIMQPEPERVVLLCCSCMHAARIGDQYKCTIFHGTCMSMQLNMGVKWNQLISCTSYFILHVASRHV